MELECETPEKKKKIDESSRNHKTCIICKTKSPSLNLTQPRDLESWRTLYDAADIQQLDAILSHDKNVLPNDVWYHLECRKKFSHKKTLGQILKSRSNKEDTCEDQPAPLSEKQSREKTSSSSSRVYERVCIFCNKAKYVKGTRPREQLVKAVDLRSDNTLRKKAQEKMDTNMLKITSRDRVAAEAHYHRSCYKNYTRSDVSSCSKSEETNDEYQSYIFVMTYLFTRVLKP